MGRGRIVNALSFFVFLKNVFLNKHSCYYRIDNLNLRFAFLKFVISATIAVPFVCLFVCLLQNCAHKRPIFTLFFFYGLLLLYQDIF